MLKQKTVAKWLVIVLLMTIAVGSYLMYDALYNSTDSQADAIQSDTNVNANDDEIHIAYHTTLPRQSEIIDNATISHIGGEGDETLLKCINVGNKSFVFFNSLSKEYDIYENGLHFAIIEDNYLTSVSKIDASTFIDAKLYNGGIAVALKNDEQCYIFSYTLNGELYSTCQVPSFDSAQFYLSDSLYLFYTQNGYMHALKYLQNASIEKSPFTIKTSVVEIEEIIFSNDRFLILTKLNDCVYGYKFEQNNGFNTAFSIDKVSFLQIISIKANQSNNFALLFESKNSLLIATIDSNYSIQSKRFVDEIDCGLIESCEDGFMLITSGKSFLFCSHLDLISTTENNFTFCKILSFSPSSNGIIFLAQSDNYATYYSTKNGKLFDVKINLISPIICPTSYGFKVCSYSSSSIGQARANFGGSDVFLFDYTFQFV